MNRLTTLGAEALNDAELLEVLLCRPWPVELGLKDLLWASPEFWQQSWGLSAHQAAQLSAALELGRRALRCKETRPVLRSPQAIFDFIRTEVALGRREALWVLSLNSRCVLVRCARVAQGSVDQCVIDPREVFAPAIETRATMIVLAHNHPSGDCQPSKVDVELTQRLATVGALLGIRVLDHLILGDGSFCSMAHQGLLGFVSGYLEPPTTVDVRPSAMLEHGCD